MKRALSFFLCWLLGLVAAMSLPRPARPSPEPAVVQDAWLADFVAGYQKGAVHPVSALHCFAQRYSMQLDFKETGVAGKCFPFYIQLCLRWFRFLGLALMPISQVTYLFFNVGCTPLTWAFFFPGKWLPFSFSWLLAALLELLCFDQNLLLASWASSWLPCSQFCVLFFPSCRSSCSPLECSFLFAALELFLFCILCRGHSQQTWAFLQFLCKRSCPFITCIPVWAVFWAGLHITFWAGFLCSSLNACSPQWMIAWCGQNFYSFILEFINWLFRGGPARFFSWGIPLFCWRAVSWIRGSMLLYSSFCESNPFIQNLLQIIVYCG